VEPVLRLAVASIVVERAVVADIVVALFVVGQTLFVVELQQEESLPMKVA
tara:strand:- start:26 stop:175 length:150 start_codon:yes stop_codon:yes gene_type:complete